MTVALVPTRQEYADLWHKWRSEPNTLRYNPIVVTDLSQLRERMTNMSSDLSDLTASKEFQYFIDVNGQLVGTVSLNNISQMMMYGEIGYDVGEEFQGRGIGTKGVAMFVSKIFSETKMRRLIAYVAEDNIPSRKLLERVGFLQEGICREHYLINGRPTNEVLYGILRSDLTR